jgi:hypothetical protein
LFLRARAPVSVRLGLSTIPGPGGVVALSGSPLAAPPVGAKATVGLGPSACPGAVGEIGTGAPLGGGTGTGTLGAGSEGVGTEGAGSDGAGSGGGTGRLGAVGSGAPAGSSGRPAAEAAPLAATAQTDAAPSAATNPRTFGFCNPPTDPLDGPAQHIARTHYRVPVCAAPYARKGCESFT